jgi:hypothetical protein
MAKSLQCFPSLVAIAFSHLPFNQLFRLLFYPKNSIEVIFPDPVISRSWSFPKQSDNSNENN